jgi:hypothetical protein
MSVGDSGAFGTTVVLVDAAELVSPTLDPPKAKLKLVEGTLAGTPLFSPSKTSSRQLGLGENFSRRIRICAEMGKVQR